MIFHKKNFLLWRARNGTQVFPRVKRNSMQYRTCILSVDMTMNYDLVFIEKLNRSNDQIINPDSFI